MRLCGLNRNSANIAERFFDWWNRTTWGGDASHGDEINSSRIRNPPISVRGYETAQMLKTTSPDAFPLTSSHKFFLCAHACVPVDDRQIHF